MSLDLASLRISARVHAERLRLVLARDRGPVGRSAGSGTGSSLDYQDHRPFYLGDDPRRLDWNAYARTGQLISKIYRAEIAPAVDLVFDASKSVALTAAKWSRSLELLFFLLESALAGDARVQVWFAGRTLVGPISGRSLLAEASLPEVTSAEAPRLDRVLWRSGALRIWITDLLFEGSPEVWAAHLVGPGAPTVVFAPYDPAEADPPWRGNLELEDLDTAQVRSLAATESFRERYRVAYQQHFQSWQNSLMGRGAQLLRISSSTSFLEAMEPVARAGVVEPR